MTDTPIRILLVEDDQDDFVLIRGLLTEIYQSRLNLHWRKDFDSALIALNDLNIDVCLFDFRLGRHTGLELLDEVHSFGDQIPIIMLTGYQDREVDLSAMEKGASDFLVKSELSANLLERSIRYSIKRIQNIKEIRQINAANDAKSRFLANMSHEIRTPLCAITGFADLALDPGVSPSAASEYLNTIKRNSEHLMSLINNILDLSKVEAGKIQCEAVNFRIKNILEEISTTFLPQVLNKGMMLSIEIDSSTPEYIGSDPTRLRQILVNLVGNSIKFSHGGEIKIELKRSPSGLEFLISDSGVGMSRDQQQRLFQRFSQADDSTTRKFGGTGLGLTLSRELARALGGDLILLESRPNAGTSFKLSLPTVATLHSKVTAVRTAHPESALRNTRLLNRKILLVEDSPDNQELIKEYLALAGAEIEIAGNGKEGIDRALSLSYDAVLMDIQMPEMDGNEATSRLREKGFDKPIIALTAHAMLEDRERALKSGFSDYVTKPIDRKMLIEKLYACIPQTRQMIR